MRYAPPLMLLCSIAFFGCGSPEPAAAASPATTPQVQMNMLQLMRAFPFPHSNVVFDTQTKDPVGPEKKAAMVFSLYRWGDSDTYAGWEGVENSALALGEMAPLLLTPRKCANGLDGPVDQADWKKAVQELQTVSQTAYQAAHAKNLEAFLDVGEKLANACASCHDKYRDVDLSGGQRCKVGT